LGRMEATTFKVLFHFASCDYIWSAVPSEGVVAPPSKPLLAPIMR